MNRLKLLCAMLALAALMVFAVMLGSPYEPVIEPVADIEAIWAIEDARQESEAPLVRLLHNHGVPLGYDAESNTFYCPLNLEQGEAWPDIHLTAVCNPDVRLVFVDDYGYDWCEDAIREGYPYQVMAYTDDEFRYFNIVFTGLPIVSIYCEKEIGEEDTAARVEISIFGEEGIGSAANIHLRGGGTRSAKKRNLRVKFTRAENGKKNMIDLPSFGLRENIILNPMVMDETMLRDRVSWRLYGDLLGEEYNGAFDERETAYVEVFLNNEYQGVYLMMEPMDAEEELAKESGQNLLTDGVYRSLHVDFVENRPVINNPLKDVGRFELLYEPQQSRRFEFLQDYLNLLSETDNAEFIQKATCMDMESVVRYVLLRQIAGLVDNINNNMYIWARMTQTGVKYTLVPWDLDKSWGRQPQSIGNNNENWLHFPLADRMLMCGVPGLKELLVQRWREWREDALSQEHIMEILVQYESELLRSGALMRNAERWGMQMDTAASERLGYFASTRLEVLDAAMDMFEDEELEYPPFLNNGDEEPEHRPIM